LARPAGAFATDLGGAGAREAGLVVITLRGLVLFSCATTRSGRAVDTPRSALINSSMQIVKTVAFIAFGLPPVSLIHCILDTN
jgi:hypothetical protein